MEERTYHVSPQEHWSDWSSQLLFALCSRTNQLLEARTQAAVVYTVSTLSMNLSLWYSVCEICSPTRISIRTLLSSMYNIIASSVADLCYTIDYFGKLPVKFHCSYCKLAQELSVQLSKIYTTFFSLISYLWNIFKWLKLVLSQLSNKLQLKLMVYHTLDYKESSDAIYLPILGGVSIHWTHLWAQIIN